MMTIELVFTAMGAKPAEEWWIKIAGTCVVRLGLSPRACETEVRMLAEQTLCEMVRNATVAR